MSRGVTNPFFFFVLILFSFCNEDPKQPVQWVFDFESVLDSTQEKQLTDLYINHEKKTTNEIVLITTPDYGSDTSIMWYSHNMFRSFGIGKKDINNGVLIVFSGANREVRIATGYGTEHVLTDLIAYKFIDSLMLPNFREGKIFKGIWAGSKAIVEFLERPENKIPRQKSK